MIGHFVGCAPDVSIILRPAHLDHSCRDSMAISTETEVTDPRHGPFITGPRRRLQHTDKCEAEKKRDEKSEEGRRIRDE